MKFPQNFFAGAGVLTAGAGVLTAGAGVLTAGAGVLTAGAGGEMTGVCTALLPPPALYTYGTTGARCLLAKALRTISQTELY